MNATDFAQSYKYLAATNAPKGFTPYLTVGDEPPQGLGVIDLNKQMTPDNLTNLRNLLTFLPRQNLRDWYEKSIRANLSNITPKFINAGFSSALETQDLYGNMTAYLPADVDADTWAAMIELFNEVNAAYILANKLQVIDWEANKTVNHYQDQATRAFNDFKSSIQNYMLNPPKISAREMDLTRQFAALPKLGDPGLNINLQNAVKQLLILGRTDSTALDLVQTIINAYNQGHAQLGAVLTSPIMKSVTLPDGNVLLAT